MSKKTIEVYWSPAPFMEHERQWNFFYQEPQPVYKDLASANKGAPLIQCPAFKHTSKNLFSLNSQIEDKHFFEDGLLEQVHNAEVFNQPLQSGGRIALQKPRNSNIKNHVNLTYNLSWIFAADEPLVMRASAPYFPSVSPAEDAKMAFGEFDIGQWFRPWQLDYHLPLETKTFEVKENQPLAFLEFMTDKQVIFRRFKLTKHVHEIVSEVVASSNYLQGSSLTHRYKKLKHAGIREMMLKEIRQNLI